MTYYGDLGFSDCQVAGAVAEATLHDLRANVGFPGFPQIDVSDDPDGSFTVVLRWNKISSTPVHLSKAEARAAVKKFRCRAKHDQAFLDKVQKAVFDLEIKAPRYTAAS
jgi:hypothetical protein